MSTRSALLTPDLSEHRINDELDRILSNCAFVKSARLKRFLRYIVEQTLAGHPDSLKEYTIALDVFDRSETFDPQTNSIVRVEASRLRSKLEKYNAVEGCDDPLSITLPVGSYVPAFCVNGKCRDATRTNKTPSWLTLKLIRKLFFQLAVSVFAIVNAQVIVPDVWPSEFGSALRHAVDHQSLAVLPLRGLSDDQDHIYLAEGITDALIHGLTNISNLQVKSAAWTMRDRDAQKPIGDIAAELNVNYVVEGSVLGIANRMRITTQLIDAQTSRILWAESFSGDTSDVLEIQQDIVERLQTFFSSTVLASSMHANTASS